MAKSVKTPAMILQEYTVREGIPPPEFNLIRSKTGTHENEFHYQVIVDCINAFGFGRSKQVAKHDAAQKALQLLSEKGKFEIDSGSIQEFNAKLHRNETDSLSIPPLNYVGTLKDLCLENKISYPTFQEISDVGPPHARKFTWKCFISSVTTEATANTKKQAKQLCAMQMLEKLKEVLPELVKEEEMNKNAITENEIVINKYLELTGFAGIIPDKSINIGDYDIALKKLMKEKNFNYDTFKEEFSEKSETALERILDKLELKQRVDKVQEFPYCIVVITLSLDVPFSCAGIGTDFDKAKSNALEQVFFTMECYMLE